MIINCDSRALSLHDQSVQCVVTSPPYWGLRDYGTARWDGGDPACDHSQARIKTRFDYALSVKQTSSKGTDRKVYLDWCPCGANKIDKQIGAEQSPDEYVSTLVAVFQEVRRVLRDDGTVWLNLGDSYAGSGKGRQADGSHHQDGGKQGTSVGTIVGSLRKSVADGLKPKDLCFIPHRVAMALQADGWYCRSSIVWAKPNPMPESVRDRPTKSHEYIFLLSKSERYYYDAGAIREPVSAASLADGRTERGKRGTKGKYAAIDGNCGFNPEGRNKRDVWVITPKPYRGAHFATFPEALVEPCILAGSKPDDLVFDPFLGSGTVGAVAQRLGRRWVGTELNPEYCKLAAIRTGAQIVVPECA